MITVNWNPDRHQLRSFGVVGLVVFGALGAWAFYRQGLVGLTFPEPVALWVAVGLWIVAATCGVLAVTAPAALLPLYRALTAVSLPVGRAVSTVVLAILFFGVLTPIGLMFRLVGRDPLGRKLDPTRRTYWEPRAVTGGVRRYYRQF